MKIIKEHNYYAEDMVPYATVREHLRYESGDADDLIRAYVEAACDYMETITNRVFCSSTPDALHEDPDNSYSLTITPEALNATVTVYLNRGDVKKVHALRGITGTWAVTSIQYMNDSDTYVDFTDTKARVRLTGYPVEINFTEAEEPTDANEYGVDLYKVVLTGGDNVNDLPRQYRQALLLLVGHYDMHREAETLGAVTNEVKEGVHRLLNSVRQY
jgi:hypothetical protein